MVRFFIVLLTMLFVNLNVTYAADDIYEFSDVTGYALMEEEDTLSSVKRKSLLNAKSVALEQAGTHIVSYSEVKNGVLTVDEILSIAAGIVHVLEMGYSYEELYPGEIVYSAKIKGYVDLSKADEMIRTYLQNKNNNIRPGSPQTNNQWRGVTTSRQKYTGIVIDTYDCGPSYPVNAETSIVSRSGVRLYDGEALTDREKRELGSSPIPMIPKAMAAWQIENYAGSFPLVVRSIGFAGVGKIIYISDADARKIMNNFSDPAAMIRNHTTICNNPNALAKIGSM